MTATKAWIYVIVGGSLELFWMSGLKYASLWWQYALTAFSIMLSFYLMIQACKVIEVGIAYSVFVGLGTAGIVLAEIFYFGKEASAYKLFFIALIFLSVIGLKFSPKLK